MEKVRQLLSLLFVLVCGLCIVIWAGYFNDDLDFLDLARYAPKFPMGPDVGPVAFAFGSLFVAWLIWSPGEEKHVVVHHQRR